MLGDQTLRDVKELLGGGSIHCKSLGGLNSMGVLLMLSCPPHHLPEAVPLVGHGVSVPAHAGSSASLSQHPHLLEHSP